MNPILYLDFDGVLHPQDVFVTFTGQRVFLSKELVDAGHRLFEHCNLLEEALKPYPTVEIVLSTTWAKVFTFQRAAQFLPLSLACRVIAGTFDHSTMRLEAFDAMPRGFQVLADARRRGASNWIALDDDVREWPDGYRDRLVPTHPVQGIADPRVFALLRQRLQMLKEGSP